MATKPPIANCIELVLKGHHGAQSVINVFHFANTSAGNLVTQANLRAAFIAQVLPKLLLCLSNTYFADLVTTRDLSSSSGLGGSTPLTGSNQGNRAGISAPGGTALAVSWRTNITGRSRRGRSYTGPFGVGDLLNGDTLNSTILTALVNFALALISINAGTPLSTPVVASFKHQYYTGITSAIVDATLDSMRRRLVGRGT